VYTVAANARTRVGVHSRSTQAARPREPASTTTASRASNAPRSHPAHATTLVGLKYTNMCQNRVGWCRSAVVNSSVTDRNTRATIGAHRW
jgi:hypothetical protein